MANKKKRIIQLIVQGNPVPRVPAKTRELIRRGGPHRAKKGKGVPYRRKPKYPTEEG